MELGGKKVGVNDPCPCGARLKYKKCCLERNRKEGITVRFIPRESMNGSMKELEDRVERQHAFRKPFLQEQGYYLRECQPLGYADIVIENSDFERPEIGL